jgi:hypothetical protein
MCLIGVLFYFNAGRLEARDGSADHSLLWASLSLLTSVAAISLGAGWIQWLVAQAGLLIAIAVMRVVLEGDAR